MKDEFINIKADIDSCELCILHETRKNAITGGGIEGAPVMIIGEAPGADEDEKGIPFIGRSGKLLTQMLYEIGLDREKNLYITNTIKCRPPENRNPKPEETSACKGYLDRQIELHNPIIILLVGNFALKYFFKKSEGISKVHGDFIELDGRIAFPVYHPAAVLRNPKLKPIAEADFQKLKEFLEENRII